MKPLLVDVVENHPDLDIDKVNGDGIFNSQACRDIVMEMLGNDAELFASVNPRNKICKIPLVGLLKSRSTVVCNV